MSLLLIFTVSKDNLIYLELVHPSILVKMFEIIRPTKCRVSSDTVPLRKSFAECVSEWIEVFPSHLGLGDLCIILSAEICVLRFLEKVI